MRKNKEFLCIRPPKGGLNAYTDDWKFRTAEKTLDIRLMHGQPRERITRPAGKPPALEPVPRCCESCIIL